MHDLELAVERRSDEADLVSRARQRDEAAVRAIVRCHNRRLFRLARSIVKDDSEAEDVVQESYIRAFTKLAEFRGESRLSTWLARIVLNEALGRLRSRRPTVEWAAMDQWALPGEIAAMPGPSIEIDPERATAQREVRLILEEAIDDLPQAFRTVLVARLVEGMSIEETAELLGLRAETVKTRLHRARLMLRRAVEDRLGAVLADAFPFAGERCARMAEGVLAALARSH